MLVTAKSWQSTPVGDKGELMPVAVKFYLFLFVVCVVVFLIAVRLGPLSVMIKVTFKVALAFLAIMIGRWLLGPRNL
jgi:hypothetical protein